MNGKEGRDRKALLSTIGCCLAVCWAGSLAFGYPGVMGPHWQKMFGVGAAQIGLVVTFMLLAMGCGMFFAGKIFAKIGLRKCIWITTVFQIIAMLFLMNAKSMTLVYAWAFTINIGLSFVYGNCLATTQQWMPHKRGLASGIINLIFGISAAIMSPIWNRMLDTVGYDKLNLMLTVGMVATNIVASFLAEVPARANLTEEERAAQEELVKFAAANAKKRGRAPQNFTVGQAVRTKAFWLIWFTWVFMGAAGISMVSLSKSYAISLGLAAVVILTAFNITNGVGRLIAGAASDVIGPENMGIIAFIVTAIGYVCLSFVHSTVGVAVFAACIGFGLGTLFTITAPMASGIFGLKNFSTIFGLIFTAYGFIGGIVGPLVAGIVLDRTGGNYSLVFGYLAVFALIGTVLIAILKKVGPNTHITE